MVIQQVDQRLALMHSQPPDPAGRRYTYRSHYSSCAAFPDTRQCAEQIHHFQPAHCFLSGTGKNDFFNGEVPGFNT